MPSLKSRYFFIFWAAFLIPVFYLTAQFYLGQNYLKNPNRVTGYVSQLKTWDQFGHYLILENRWSGRQVEKILPPNGFFVFENLEAASYRLWVRLGTARFYVSE